MSSLTIARIVFILVAAACLAMLLTACGGGDPEDYERERNGNIPAVPACIDARGIIGHCPP